MQKTVVYLLTFPIALLLGPNVLNIFSGNVSNRGSIYNKEQIEVCNTYDDQYKLICITNNTKHAINYSFSWGNLRSGIKLISPGNSLRHFWKSSGHKGKDSPEFNVRFDNDPRTPVHYTSLFLTGNKSSDLNWAAAKQYVFEDLYLDKIEISALD